MPASSPRRARAAGRVLYLVSGSFALAAPAARAQLPSLPAAQSAFPAPGLAVALDGGRTDGRGTVALAGATGVRRLQLTAAVGVPGAPAGYERSDVSLGARLALRVYRSTRLGVSAFAGLGGERFHAPAPLPSPYALGAGTPGALPPLPRPLGRLTLLPVGVSTGVRGLVGARPYAVSVVPMFAYTRWAVDDTSRARSGARLAALAEIALTPRIGLGVGGEIGTGGPDGSPFPGRRSAFGAGLSYAIQRAVAR